MDSIVLTDADIEFIRMLLFGTGDLIYVDNNEYNLVSSNILVE